jgi:hypothetical protein
VVVKVLDQQACRKAPRVASLGWKIRRNNGDVIDILVQSHRDQRAAEQFLDAAVHLFDLASIPKSVQNTWMNTEPDGFACAEHAPRSVNTWRTFANLVSLVATDKNYG